MDSSLTTPKKAQHGYRFSQNLCNSSSGAQESKPRRDVETKDFVSAFCKEVGAAETKTRLIGMTGEAEAN